MSGLPVIELFGPTIQGEGELAGLPTCFVRFGGCDYRCRWCDSLHAVRPEDVRAAPRLDAPAVVAALDALGGGADWVTLSGGNPALLELEELVALLHERGRRVAVETQGSRWRPWLGDVDLLTVSPKPPSSGMATRAHEDETERFLDEALAADAPVVLKVVVFDEEDLDWARDLRARRPGLPFHLSCGTDPAAPERPHGDTLLAVSERYRWLCERVAADPDLTNARVLPQLHVLAWGHEQGR